MPREPNKALRLLVPIGVAIVGVGVVIAVVKNTGRQPQPAPGPVPTAPIAQTPTQPAATPTPAATPAASSATPPQPATTPVSLEGLKAQAVEPRPFAAIGSLDVKSPLECQVEFSEFGAGVKQILLTRHFETIKKERHVVIQAEQSWALVNQPNQVETVTPLAAVALEIDGKPVSLLFGTDVENKPLPLWREVSPGVFEAVVVNGAGEKVARVERKYSVTPGSFIVQLNQSVTNLSGAPLNFRWQQFGPVDLEGGNAGYGGDKRRVRFGYLLAPEAQRADPTVLSDEFQYSRQAVLGRKDKSGYFEEVREVWPNASSARDKLRLVWFGVSNRYFGTALVPLVAPNAGPDAKVLHAAANVDRVLVQRVVNNQNINLQILRSTSNAYKLEPGASADLSMGVYAGPLERTMIRKDAAAKPAGLDGLVLYNFGGMCGPCTFSFLTGWLLGLLRFLHANITFDWALSIMVLVLIVRTILHPVTKWSQIRLQRFGKQMQGMAPKQKKIQEKFKDDPRKMKEEMAKLWREEGVNPAQALGCVPMFLQMPVWIALYATLYFAFELRHQPAFFGVFQALFPGHPPLLGWFLGDLAEPDRFYYFQHDIHVPLLSTILGPINSINVLPVILGVVFYIQQKYLTPPPTTPLTPEQQQQQAMVKWMMVFLFPLMMYNAPSGLALYFIVNSTLGILESRYIRSHINKYDLLKPPGPKGPKPGGFLERLQKIAEERQKQMMKAKGQYPPRKKV